MRNLSLSVFFPCYNEEANVERTTLAALDACRSISDDFEIIIVDDGSRDRTAEIADRLTREHECVRAVHNRPNRGYGGALQRGFEAATKEWVFYTDGDGQFDFKEIHKLLDLLDRYDIVSAYRLDRCDSVVRRLNGWGWTMLCNLVLGLRLRDIDCAFKIYPRRLFDEITMASEGALIDRGCLDRRGDPRPGHAPGLSYGSGRGAPLPADGRRAVGGELQGHRPRFCGAAQTPPADRGRTLTTGRPSRKCRTDMNHATADGYDDMPSAPKACGT